MLKLVNRSVASTYHFRAGDEPEVRVCVHWGTGEMMVSSDELGPWSARVGGRWLASAVAARDVPFFVGRLLGTMAYGVDEAASQALVRRVVCRLRRDRQIDAEEAYEVWSTVPSFVGRWTRDGAAALVTLPPLVRLALLRHGLVRCPSAAALLLADEVLPAWFDAVARERGP